MPRLKPDTIMPGDEEGAAITAAALSDPDASPLTDEECDAVKPRPHGGRTPLSQRKVSAMIRFDVDVLAAMNATGPGWQIV